MLKVNGVIRKTFAYRHDVLKALIADGARLVVLGRSEQLSNLPEFRESRSLGGSEEVRYLDYDPKLKLIVVLEEIVLGLPSDQLAGEGWFWPLCQGPSPGRGNSSHRHRLRQEAAEAAITTYESSASTLSSISGSKRSMKPHWPGVRGRARRWLATGSNIGPRASRRTSTHRDRPTHPTMLSGRSLRERP
jgi:hypothetical protein